MDALTRSQAHRGNEIWQMHNHNRFTFFFFCLKFKFKEFEIIILQCFLIFILQIKEFEKNNITIFFYFFLKYLKENKLFF